MNTSVVPAAKGSMTEIPPAPSALVCASVSARSALVACMAATLSVAKLEICVAVSVLRLAAAPVTVIVNGSSRERACVSFNIWVKVNVIAWEPSVGIIVVM